MKPRSNKPPVLARGAALLLTVGVAAVFGLPACSLFNQEGPSTSCEQLACGRINACQEGIIAQCADGVHLKYHVCGSTDICGDSWQIKGQFKCSSDDTDCEGCRPERTGCSDIPTGAGGGSAQGGGGGASSSSGGV